MEFPRGETIASSLERGLGYLARVPEDASATFLRSIALHHTGCLLLTAVDGRTMGDGEESVRVSTVADGPGSIDPKRLPELRAAAVAFLDRCPGGLIILDCLESLALHNGVERVVRIVEDLHDEVSTREATLLVLIDAARTNPRLLAMLARELDDLPSPSEGPPSPDALFA